MYTLENWLGKADDITINYDAGVSESSALLTDSGGSDYSLPALIYPTSDNMRDVTDAVFETAVKKADQTDYLISIACGAISGLVDAFYVGEFSIERANEWGAEHVNRFVMKVAKLNGFKGEKLADAIRFMENKFPLAADGNTPEFGGGTQHHLRDFSHHFSLGGLLCSLFTQFTGKVIGTNTNGTILIVEAADKSFIGKNFEEKVVFGVIDWFFHMVSDMAGSSTTVEKGKEGIGIPGPIVSLIKELSALPCFRNQKIDEKEFHTWVSKLFNGTLLARRDENGKILDPVKFDLRTEIGILHEIGRQFIPVLINECLVRGAYFLRRLYIAIKETEIHSISDLKKIEPSDVLPYNNRIIKRMITVASGTFTAVDNVDAIVRAAIKAGGINPAFFKEFAVRINIVGVGRFIIACKADARFIAEDIAEARENRERIEKEHEQMISDLKCLSLSYEQMRVLYSLERCILLEDLYYAERMINGELKKKWVTEWERRVLTDLPVTEEAAETFFMTKKELMEFLNDQDEAPWIHLVAMEALLFVPYGPIFGDDRDKEYKRFKVIGDYLEEVFVDEQNKITKKDLANLKKAHRQACLTISGTKKGMAIGALGTVAAIVTSGGLAFTFAPAIAVVLAGEAAAGLSGAALVNFSLALIGGGALAAGGLGMAGGTAIIAGGGALLGMLSGTGISAATALNLLSNDGYVYSECCKLLAFSKAVLRNRFNDYDAIADIKREIDGCVASLQGQIEELSDKEDDKADDNDIKERKIKIRAVKKSVLYLKRTSEELQKLYKRNTAQTTEESEDER